MSSTVKIAPVAFNDSEEYVYRTETLEDLQEIQRFFNDNTTQAQNKGLSEAARAEVILTSELEDIWRLADFTNPDVVTWRFVGTKQGVLRTYPGLRLQKTYSHRQQSWYRQAASSPETLVVSLRTSAYERDRMLSFSKAIRKTSCEGSQLGDLLAVMGMEMTESAFLHLITNNLDLNENTNMTWYVLERSGHIMLNFSSSTILQPYKKHLTEAIPWLANELIKKEKILKASWCNDYQQHAVEMFYELLDLNGASSNSSDPCRQFTISPVQGTSLFLLGLPSRNVHNCLESAITSNERCSCGKFCNVCSSDAMLNCQCPCSCHMSYDECDNSVTRLWTSLPCPVPAPPLFDTEKEEKALQEALATVPRCARDCLNIGNITECQKTVGCHWCFDEESPSCSSECRTGQSLWMHVLFPCQNFMNLSTEQQNSLKYLFTKALIHLVPTLSPLNIANLHLQKDGIKFKLYGSTSNSDLKTMQENIQHLVKQGKIVLGPVIDLPEIYTARSSEHFTNLHILLTLDQALPQTSQELSANIETQLQPILVTLLGRSHVSRIRRFNFYNKTSVQFSLSNEGEIDRHPIHNLTDRLEAAVTTGQVFFNVHFVPGEAATKKILATKMFALGGFDFLCHPFTSTSAQTTQHYYSSTEWSATTSLTYTEKEKENKQGLTPVEIAVVVTASLLTASSCPCILFLLLTKRRNRSRKGKVSPDGGPDEDPPSELSDISEIDSDMNIAVNRTYCAHEPTRIQLTPKEAWARAKQLTIPAPKNIPEGAWF